jgi:peptidoglycan/LPS O-acetylase OafA/YrhL
MTHYILKRILLALPALWLVLTLVLLIHIVPGDPVEQMLGEGAAPGQVAQLRHAMPPGSESSSPSPVGAPCSTSPAAASSTPRTRWFFPAVAVIIAVLSFNCSRTPGRDWLDPSTRAQLEVAHLPR